jgi:hypothetical protein
LIQYIILQEDLYHNNINLVHSSLSSHIFISPGAVTVVSSVFSQSTSKAVAISYTLAWFQTNSTQCIQSEVNIQVLDSLLSGNVPGVKISSVLVPLPQPQPPFHTNFLIVSNVILPLEPLFA